MTGKIVRFFIISSCVLVTGIIAPDAFAQQPDSLMTRKAQVTFVYPIGSNGRNALKYSNNLSLNILYGANGGLNGFELGGLLNYDKSNVTGFQIAGLGNVDGKSSKGFLLAGVSNIIKGSAGGFQVAGLTNLISGNSGGFMVSGLLNTYKNATGVQIAGFANLSMGDVENFQLAGFLNTSGNLHAVQIGGFANLSKKVNGLQLAGFINKANDVKGVQASGFINIAKKVNGVQLSGFINIADSSDYPIGVVNIIKNGEKSLGLSMDETFTTMVLFRSGGRVLYGIIGTGYNFKNKDFKYAFEGGLGANLVNRKSFRIRAEAISLVLTRFEKVYCQRTFLHIFPSVRIDHYFDIYAGPTINYVDANSSEGRQLIKNYIWKHTSNNHFKGIYIGLTGGISIPF